MNLFLLFENLHPACIVCQLSTGKAHFLVNIRHQSVGSHICDRLQDIVFEILLHFSNVAHTLFRQTLKLGNVYVVVL